MEVHIGSHVVQLDPTDWFWVRLATIQVSAGKRRRLFDGIRLYPFGRGGPYSLLHRVLLSAKEGELVDHINGNPMDNRRENLRICTALESARNVRKHHDGRHPYKGVKRARTKSERWEANIYAGRPIYVGSFATIEDAARAYDAAARQHHGEFARLNFPAGA